MVIKDYLIFGLVLIGAMGCKPRIQPGNTPRAEDILGRWEAREIIVTTNFGKVDQQRKSLDPALSDSKRPMITKVLPTGVFSEERWSKTDSLLSSKTGFWHQYQDSLYLSYIEEGSVRNAFGLDLSATKMVLTLAVDFDGDGQKDDRMEITMKKD